MVFIPNPRLEEEWRDGEGRELLTKVAGEVAENARSIAPVATGAYQSKIEPAEEGDEVRVVAGDWKSGWIEFGTRYHSAFAPLRRGAELSGLKVEAKRVRR